MTISLFSQSLSPFSLLQFPSSTTNPVRRHVTLRPQFPNPKMIRVSTRKEDFLEEENAEVLVTTCITRTLPPALTLEQGLQKIKGALDELKCNPPHSSSGMFRFQVLVPPSAKALQWFCCQPESSVAFPQFFLSRDKDNPTLSSLSLKGLRGVFGIGTAVLFKGSSSIASTEWSSSKRFLSVDSNIVTAYGFMDVNFDVESSSINHTRGSYYFFIPEIELDESEGMCTLLGTLVWDKTSSLCAFEEATKSFELALYQIIHHLWNSTDSDPNRCIASTLRKFTLVEDKSVQMVYSTAPMLGQSWVVNDAIELKERSPACQFFFRLSKDLAISNNVLPLGDVNKMSHSIRHCPNINSLWASMIVEECSRLGLMYFCIAPGSRSSPLAIAASSHPLTTCISCYDERSLAFHAVGYAKGSCKPAVVITSSGTAVSNLLPAIVEASQNFVPLLLLTADRPPELQDVGANQSINQVNHFGSFVRFFYGLPAPSDEVPARMVLTTIDSALHLATSTPCGPVHINCPFREPLDGNTKQWSLSCLKGIDFWMSSPKPFTSYINTNYSYACDGTHGQMVEVVEAIQRANRGLLVIGEIRKEDDIWAAQLLAKHFSWPVIADILSGLRLRKYLSQIGMENNFYFIDHLDHLLLSDSVRDWAHADVIVQIGSRITSKRNCQMLEDCFPCTYIFVDEHPLRHDPSHLVTHRIQSTITEFADCLLKAHIPKISKWCDLLGALNKVVAWEMSKLIQSEHSLTEPYVSYMIPETLSSNSAIFLGNSMAIRDADMYIRSYTECMSDVSALSISGLPYFWVQVAGNRGASGIDGLLSTAVGFAVGCNKRVICVLGDISFLHDTNGLALLKQRICRKPMTILVLNNHGGAIFSFLPIADKTEQRVLDQYFYTAHDISLRNLCLAHGLKHVPVATKLELNYALLTSQQEEVDTIIEVESSIDGNASFHRMLKQFACQAAEDSLSLLSSFSLNNHMLKGTFLVKICEMKYSRYRIQLRAPPTSTSAFSDSLINYKEGFIIALSLEDGCIGYGEVAPIEIHTENLADVEEQLRFFIHILKGAELSYLVPLLKGSFSSWFLNSLGILPASIFPSVRCGLEMAILNVIATRERSSLLNLLHRETNTEDKLSESSSIQICALLDSKGTPKDVANIAAKLVAEGFSAIKVKVARRSDPIEDAMVIREVRNKVGPSIKLRVDANQKWSYEEAVRFGHSVINCDLQYVEEPVSDVDDVIKFCEETGLHVALDETIDNIHENPLEMLAKFTHSGVAAVVIKPSVVGGFENAALIARWAQQQGKMSVISATFESSLGLSAYIQFSCYLELQSAMICRLQEKDPLLPVAHGLGTYQWLKEDISYKTLKIQRGPYNGFIEASAYDASCFLREFQVKDEVILGNFSGENVQQYRLEVNSEGFSFLANIREIGGYSDDNIVVFLHGFLGTGEEWTPIMKAISQSARCIAVDLPGHGGSTIDKDVTYESAEQPSLSVEDIADVIEKLCYRFTPGKVTLVGYSMGARIALYMALRCPTKVKGVVMVSGSPGLKDASARKIRRAKDDSKACSLIAHGLELFLDNWYASELWKSLRDHPCFKDMLASRLQQDDLHSLAKVLSDSSVGRQPPLWDDLKDCKVPLRLIVGAKDHKFKSIAHTMLQEVSQGANSPDHKEDKCKIVEVPNCGHAVHLENPLSLISAISRFLNNSEKY